MSFAKEMLMLIPGKFIKIPLIIIAFNFFIFAPGALANSQILIIANKNLPIDSLTKDQIKNIFLGTTTRWQDKSTITFVTLQKNDVHKIFVRKYTNKSSDQFRAFWRRQLFTGKGKIPKTYKTEQALIQFIAQTKGSIGYVSKSADIDNVKLIKVSD